MSLFSRLHSFPSGVHPSLSGIPSEKRNAFLWAGGISLLAWMILQVVAPGAEIPWTEKMLRASATMDSMVASLRQHCQEEAIVLNAFDDPNRTCLIGPEMSPLFTSLGQLEAKRTSTNPDMAGLVAHLLTEAGVEAGDRVALGASGSFPALLVASLSAVEALGAEPTTILSLGSSSFGATRPEFHLLDLYRFMEDEGWVSRPPEAVSLGGSGDVGAGFDSDFRHQITEEARESGVPLLDASDLQTNVAERMAIYGDAAAFINIGGGQANLGTSPKVLEVPPGLSAGKPGREAGEGLGGIHGLNLPPPAQRGVLFEMAARGVPVIHLLHVQGLALRYGLQWDPMPLPIPGETRFRDSQRGKGLSFWIVTAGYLLALTLVGLRGWSKQTPRKTVR
jgi:poly-gamma-glutamate system protein